MMNSLRVRIVACLTIVLCAHVAHAERLCDSSRENCRTPLLSLINNETQGIDVGFWFMEDSRYSTALIAAHNRGVPVRVLVDTKANSNYPRNATIIGYLRDGGIPIRRITSSWLHWKMMLFAGQNVVQCGSANYSSHAFVPSQPLANFIDETILFSDDPSIVNSFRTRFDDAWVSSRFTNYANASAPPTRSYPVYSISSALNFPPFQNFATRSVARYNAETTGIDIVMYRLGDRRHADAIIAARQRGVAVRLYTEQSQYREPRRPTHAYDVDRLYMAGVQIRHRNHRGWNHEKLTLLRGQRMAIFGSQNWTHTAGQYEHNYFTTKSWIYQWLSDRFARKWNSTGETKPFVPQPPMTPQNRLPFNGAQLDASQVTLRWYAGLWAHKYDIYFGTSSNPPRIASDLELGYSASSSDLKSFTVTGLAPNTTYYWRIVSKTMANMARSGPVWSVYTAGAVAITATLPSGWQSRDIGAVGVAGSATESGGSFTVRGAGADVWGASDGFRYAYRSLSGDGTITARVSVVAGTQAWTKVGVMIRASTSASAAHAFMIVSTGKGLAFQRRRSSGGLTTHTSGGTGTAPRWVRLTRIGSRVTAYVSTTGATWTTVGSDTFSLSSTVLVGLAVSSHSTSSLATGVFDNVSVSGAVASSALPSGWHARDIGSVGATGSASHADGAFIVRGSGEDIWGSADAFHIAYRLLSGDGAIIARLTSLVGTEAWTKAGVMIRASTAENAAHAFMLVSRGKGLAFQRRTSTGALSVHTSGGSGTAPRWVRLTRDGGTISAYRSGDGNNWTLVGADTFTMPSTALVGLAVTSHSAGTLATAEFDDVSVSGSP